MSRFSISQVRLFDGVDVLPEPCTVYISDGKVQYVGKAPTPDLMSESVVIDGSGCTLLPGLIDAHTHVFRDVQQLKGCIRAGVTTVMDMHNIPEDAAYMKDLAGQSSEFPEIFSAYYAATIRDGWPAAIVRHTNKNPMILETLDKYPKLSTADSVKAFVAKNKSQGADFIKLMQESGECLTLPGIPAPTRGLQEAVIEAAHDNGLLTIAHATNMRDTLLVLESGVDGLAHQFFDQPHTADLVDAYVKTKAFVIPTFTAISSMMGLETSSKWARKSDVAHLLSESSRSSLSCCMSIAKPECSVKYAYDCVTALKRNGIDIVCGTDSGPTIHGTALGAALHLELSLLVQHCDFSPIEALQSATEVSARRFRLNDRGRIAIGKRADLLLVRGDPTQNIQHTLNIEMVWKNGTLCETG